MEKDPWERSPFSGDATERNPLGRIPLHSTNLLTVLNAEGVVLYESPAIEPMYGFGQDDLVGKQVAEYFHPDEREDVIAAFRRIVESDAELTEAIEYRHETADGSYVWVESVASSNPTPDGNYVINTRDISERKKRETELERANDHLNRFVNTVSHDLRNPLSVAKGNLALAEAEASSDHHGKIADALDRMEVLIDDLLADARIQHGDVDITPTDLQTLCESCWQNVSTDNGTLLVDIEKRIVADRFQLMQLLENLYRNAIEHGGRDVTVTVGRLDASGRPGFYIEDDGDGIPTKDRKMVFNTGYSTSESGTGFGLSIVKQVVERHDWEIQLTEEKDGGARFEITGVTFVGTES